MSWAAPALLIVLLPHHRTVCGALLTGRGWETWQRVLYKADTKLCESRMITKRLRQVLARSAAARCTGSAPDGGESQPAASRYARRRPRCTTRTVIAGMHMTTEGCSARVWRAQLPAQRPLVSSQSESMVAYGCDSGGADGRRAKVVTLRGLAPGEVVVASRSAYARTMATHSVPLGASRVPPRRSQLLASPTSPRVPLQQRKYRSPCPHDRGCTRCPWIALHPQASLEIKAEALRSALSTESSTLSSDAAITPSTNVRAPVEFLEPVSVPLKVNEVREVYYPFVGPHTLRSGSRDLQATGCSAQGWGALAALEGLNEELEWHAPGDDPDDVDGELSEMGSAAPRILPADTLLPRKACFLWSVPPTYRSGEVRRGPRAPKSTQLGSSTSVAQVKWLGEAGAPECVLATPEQQRLFSALNQWVWRRVPPMVHPYIKGVHVVQHPHATVDRQSAQPWEVDLAVVLYVTSDSHMFGNCNPLCGPSQPPQMLSALELALLQAVQGAAPLATSIAVYVCQQRSRASGRDSSAMAAGSTMLGGIAVTPPTFGSCDQLHPVIRRNVGEPHELWLAHAARDLTSSPATLVSPPQHHEPAHGSGVVRASATAYCAPLGKSAVACVPLLPAHFFSAVRGLDALHRHPSALELLGSVVTSVALEDVTGVPDRTKTPRRSVVAVEYLPPHDQLGLVSQWMWTLLASDQSGAPCAEDHGPCDEVLSIVPGASSSLPPNGSLARVNPTATAGRESVCDSLAALRAGPPTEPLPAPRRAGVPRRCVSAPEYLKESPREKSREAVEHLLKLVVVWVTASTDFHEVMRVMRHAGAQRVILIQPSTDASAHAPRAMAETIEADGFSVLRNAVNKVRNAFAQPSPTGDPDVRSTGAKVVRCRAGVVDPDPLTAAAVGYCVVEAEDGGSFGCDEAD